MSTVHTETFNINVDGKTAHSYLARPTERDGVLPGVLLIPEFWGLVEYSRQRAQQLAELGYCVLAVDIYGEGQVCQNVESGMVAMNGLLADMEGTTRWLLAHWEELKKIEQVDPEKTAAMGYCLGGALALHLARMGTDIKGAVSFHGELKPLMAIQAGGIKANVLVFHGEADTLVPLKQVEDFKKEMDAANVDYTFVGYAGVLHAFTNPMATENGKKFGIPLAYDEQADKASWSGMRDFFVRIFS